MEEKLVTIAEFDTAFEAELAKVQLEDAGIEAFILGEDLVTNMPFMPIVRVQVQVFQRDVERAQAILTVPPEAQEGEDEDVDVEDEGWDESDSDMDDDFDEESYPGQ